MLDEYIRKKDVKVLAKYYFPHHKATQNLTVTQERIVRSIAFSESKRLCINAMTRYGKSICVAIGAALYILFHSKKKVIIIAPLDDQTAIIRNYMAELITDCKELASLVEIERERGVERLKREVSQKRITFKNGCELKTVSAYQEAFRLMGSGGDLIIIDESALITREAYSKIVRMLGDDPENAILVELANPWSKDCKYYDHYISGRFDVIHIGYETALKEGRVTETFIEEMRQEITPIEFTVLYESNFPSEEEDSLFYLKWINDAINVPSEVKSGTKIISADIAEGGLDYTVIYWGYENNGEYKVEYIYSEAKSDLMQVAERIYKIYLEKGADLINIDCIGIGAGVVSRLRQLTQGKNVTVQPCHFGEAPTEGKYDDKQVTGTRKRFVNKKAEQFFRLSDLMREKRVSIPNNIKLRTELMNIKWEKTLSERIKIQEPEDKSPDFACALVYFTWKDSHKPLVINKLTIGMDYKSSVIKTESRKVV